MVDSASVFFAFGRRVWVVTCVGVVVSPLADESSSCRTRKRCDGSKLRRSGFTFTYPTFREGYTPIVDALVREQSI